MRISDWRSDVCSSDLAGTHKTSCIRVAEAAKVIENTQRDLNIALINELSLIFHRMDIDTHEVLEAAGTKWNFLPFRPGLVGGHCIGVDPYYLTHKAQQIGYHPDRSEEHTSELQSLMRISYAVFCLQKKKKQKE